MGGSQQVPTRFPCWCKAIYSWGGESKRDLGFIEGDLIECLNAGDGSWWTGRLRRDRRAVGLFPSNFVQVLDDSFQPAPITRNASPATLNNQPSHQKSSGTFRKPFQAYEKLGYKESVASRGSTPEKEKPKSKWTPYSSMKTAQAPTGTIKKQTSTGHTSPLKEESRFRVPSPPPRAVQRMKSRAHSPAPPNAGSRAPSPNPMAMVRAASPNPMTRPVSPAIGHISRAASPDPNYYRAASPNPHDQYRSHSPNPYGDYRAPSPAPYQEFHDSRAPSPQPWKQISHPSRAPSPVEFDGGMSPPPPAPPPHRTVYQASRAHSPDSFSQNQQHGYEVDGRQSPIPNSHSPGMTPSPLRDAMADVMSSLHDMSFMGRSPSPRPRSPPSVWSPEAFGQLQTQQNQPLRAQSSIGYNRQNRQHNGYSEAGAETRQSTPSLPPSRDGQPQLSSYVQRMESRLRHTRSAGVEFSRPDDDDDEVSDHPTLQHAGRPTTAGSQQSSDLGSRHGSLRQKQIMHRKSAYELGSHSLHRTMTTKTSVTSSSSGWRSNATSNSNTSNSTAHTVMSTSSAGAVSATSAGSMARRKFGMGSFRGRRPLSVLSSRSIGDMHDEYDRKSRPTSPVSGPSYHPSHATQPGAPTPVADWTTNPMDNAGILGGLSAPRAKKSGFFKKMIATAKTTAKTGAANARSTIGSASNSRPTSRAGPLTRVKSIPDGITSISSEPEPGLSSAAHRDMGLGGSDWMQVRRDVNRSNSLSKNECNERVERCQTLDILVLNPVDELAEAAEGDESIDGLPITEPTDFNIPSLALVDKSTRFVASLPASITAATLAQSYLCRQYRSDVQRLRAIFTWVSERITWEEDFEGEMDTRRVLATKRGCSEEIACLVRDLCAAVGLHAEIVRGHLKSPGEVTDLDVLSGRPNHFWNAVIVDNEWRIMDCSLAGPTNPKRSAYSSANSNVAESWYFLARPLEICYTHVPHALEQQHIVPAVAPEILLALPCACPPYFRHKVELMDFDTSMLHLENLEMAHLKLIVPEDVECVAEVEARAYAKDWDGDVFESGDVVRKSVFAQVQWVGARKVVTIKALLPGDEGTGVLKIFAGKRGLMHSIKDNPHPLALSLPLTHTGQNPPFTFLTRHPTPHAQRHDLYVVQPQCARLVINNTFVFCVRQHPSSLSRFSPDTWGSNSNGRPASPNPHVRPASAMSMVSASASQAGSNYSDPARDMTAAQAKPAKLAVQSPSGKILRLTRKVEYGAREGGWRDDGAEEGLGSSWESVIKVGERGTWRGLVLADRSARWCVFAEWECI